MPRCEDKVFWLEITMCYPHRVTVQHRLRLVWSQIMLVSMDMRVRIRKSQKLDIRIGSVLLRWIGFGRDRVRGSRLEAGLGIRVSGRRQGEKERARENRNN
eukprot:1334988-Amorphochlora_amoeboformis.AAC.1